MEKMTCLFQIFKGCFENIVIKFVTKKNITIIKEQH